MPQAVAIAALVVSAVSGYKSHEASQEAAKQQKEANKIKTATQKAADLAAIRQKAREARIRRAQIAAAAEAAGASGSSGEAGAMAGVTQNFGVQTAFQSGQAYASGAISERLNKAASYEQRANTWNAVGSISNSVFGATGGSLMGSSTPKQAAPK